MPRIEKDWVARLYVAVVVTVSGSFGCRSGAPPAPTFSPSRATSVSTPTKEPILPSATLEATVIISTPTVLIPPTPTRLPPILTPEVRASEPQKEGWIYGRPVWQDGNWFPISPAKAKREGLITLEEPLGVYDKLAKALLGEESYFQSQYKIFATNYLNSFPETADWAGFCHGLTHAELLDPQPLRGPETFTLKNGEKVTVTYQDRVGILAAFHSGDVMFRLILGDGAETSSRKYVQENLDIFIDGLIKTKQSFVINAPAPGQPGFWYRVVVAVSPDKSTLLATNLNKPGQELVPIKKNEVLEVYIPMPYKEAEAREVDLRLLKEVPQNWVYSLNGSLVNRIVYGK